MEVVEVKEPKVVLCKICCASVPRRKEYWPSCCEACQKFFRRNCKRHFELVCSGGALNCNIDSSSRRICSRCRFEKCLRAGMSSKHLGKNGTAFSVRNAKMQKDIKGKASDASGAFVKPNPTLVMSNTNRRRSNNSLEMETVVHEDWRSMESGKEDRFAFVHDPIMYDGCAVEKYLRTSVNAYTQLHGLEFVYITRPDQDECSSPAILFEPHLQAQHMAQMCQISSMFGRFYSDHLEHDLTDREIALANDRAFSCVVAVYWNLPGNKGASFFGINDSVRDKLIDCFPDFQLPHEACQKLAMELDLWNPSLAEAALLLGVLFFNGQLANVQSNGRFGRYQQNLTVAFNLHLAKMSKGNSARFEANRRRFDRCLKLAHETVCLFYDSVEKVASWFTQLAAVDEAIKSVSLLKS